MMFTPQANSKTYRHSLIVLLKCMRKRKIENRISKLDMKICFRPIKNDPLYNITGYYIYIEKYAQPGYVDISCIF